MTNTSVDANGCALNQLDTDEDGINDLLDQCNDTPAGDWNLIDANGCTDAQLEEDSGASLMDGPMKYGVIVIGVIVAVVILLFVISRIRGSRIDWD